MSVMHIQFERTGGFAGLRLQHSVDAAKLPPEEAQSLHGMVQTAGFFDLPETITTPTPGADRFQYKVSVDSGDRRHTVTIHEGATPAALKPLLAWLTDKARKGTSP
jgi:hypothetical protein